MLRFTVIPIIAFWILPTFGIAQHAPEWLDAETQEQPSALYDTASAIPPYAEPDVEHLFVQPADSEMPIRRFKKQAIQKITATGGWLIATNDNDLSSSHLETSIGIGIPLGLVKRKVFGASDGASGMDTLGKEATAAPADVPEILSITPSFRVDFIDAAAGLDIPAELYETGVSFFYRTALNDRLSAMAIVRPGVRSDFSTGDNAFRLFGLGLLIWDCVPEEVSLSFGAVYLDRADLPLLPAVGLTWSPQPKTRLELQFPQSRLAWRLAKDGAVSETWTYLAAGIGGNTWAVTRASGETDELSLGDIRLVAGLDHIIDGGGGWFAEFGYSFNRHLEYQSTQTTIDLSDGIVLQAGWRY
ncbi:MAG: DUF6268 family outer membrane beta-barrel protein [Planctomycetaceae bacterium]